MAFMKDRPVWHRVRVVAGDDEKQPFLALIQQKLFGYVWPWFFRNFADNPRRKEMHNAVSAWYELERAIKAVKQYEKDNKLAVQFAQEYRKREGVSKPYKSKQLPREELIPIPPDFKDVKERYERAVSNTGGGRKPRLTPIEDAPLTSYIPPGYKGTLPDLKLDGKQASDHEWYTRGQRGQQQQGKRKGKGNQQQRQQPNQQGPGGITITVPGDQRFEDED